MKHCLRNGDHHNCTGGFRFIWIKTQQTQITHRSFFEEANKTFSKISFKVIKSSLSIYWILTERNFSFVIFFVVVEIREHNSHLKTG